jgi:ADP-ribose pyrophosphatase YjhB (NUDIX family)
MRSIRVLALGVFRKGDRVLLARGRDPATGAPFLRPLGGGVEFGERAAEALRREIGEELGAPVGEPRLLGVLENRFEYAGRPGHEVVFVFEARFADASWYERELAVVEEGAGWEAVEWVPLDALAGGATPLTPDGILALLG